MKKVLSLLSILFFGLGLQAQSPIATLHTSIYSTAGADNAFHLEIGAKDACTVKVDCGSGAVSYEVSPAVFDQETMAIKGTAIPCTVSSAGIVRIYGDASLIDYFYAEGCSLREADISALTELEILDLGHNELTKLNLTPQTQLQALYLDDNPFSQEGLIVGTPKDNLTILEMGRIEKMGPFNLSDYPSLISFDAWGNNGLTSIDPTGCPLLRKISIDSCPINTLDVSQNPELQILNISDSGVDTLDLSHNPALTQLYASHLSGHLNTGRKLKAIDLSHNPELVYLYLGGNLLPSVDLSALTKLQSLGVQDNLLHDIDLSHNTQLVSVSLQTNYFGFRTLPLPESWWSEYYYYQHPMPVLPRYKVGSTIDFTNMTRDDADTHITLSLRGGATLVEGEDYAWENGLLTLLKAQSDSVYVGFANDAFTEYTLSATPFMVKSEADFGQPDKKISLSVDGKAGTPLTFSVGIAGATPQQPCMAFVDYGEAKVDTCLVTGETLAATRHNVSGTLGATGSVTISVPEGEVLLAFASENQPLAAFSAEKAEQLQELTLTGAGLSTIDLANNRALRRLTLQGNHLGDFTLAGTDGSFSKTMLAHLDLQNNELTSLSGLEPYALRSFNVAHNNFEQLIVLKDMDNAETIDASYNRLSTINILNCAALRNFTATDNLIYQINQPEDSHLENVDIRRNSYTFATMPTFPEGTNVLYAPQQPIKISPKGPGIDLAAQAVTVNGKTTQFLWLKEDTGEPLVENQDYSMKNGVTTFLRTDLGRVVCHLTHEAWPQFAGADALTTTATLVAPMPTHQLASFRTHGGKLSFAVRGIRPDEAVYIDWRGDGASVSEYLLSDTTYTYYSASTYNDAVAKLYTYADDAPQSVFGLYGAPLSEVNLSEMNGLQTLSLSDAGLTIDDITFPADCSTLHELSLDGNTLDAIDLTKFTALTSLNLSSNQFEAIDLSVAPQLQIVAMGRNKLSQVTFGNPALWSLDLAYNALETINLTAAPNLQQVAVFENKLTALDATGLDQLRWMDLAYNCFDIKTLPIFDETKVTYTYGNQTPLVVTCTDGKVSLASQAARNGVRTAYRWWVGVPQYNEDGELEGTELTADEDYSVKGGVTTFINMPQGEVMCTMTNATFPKLLLYTDLLTVDTAQGIDSLKAEQQPMPTTIYSLDGRKMSSTPRQGVYIQGGKKIKK